MPPVCRVCLIERFAARQLLNGVFVGTEEDKNPGDNADESNDDSQARGMGVGVKNSDKGVMASATDYSSSDSSMETGTEDDDLSLIHI